MKFCLRRTALSKAAALLSAVLLVAVLLSGCGGSQETAAPKGESEPLTSSFEGGSTKGETEQPSLPLSSPSDSLSPLSPSGADEDSSKEPLVYIGCGTAQRLAVEHLGFEPASVKDLWSTMQKKEGVVVHEVTFIKDGTAYLCDVDAKSGAVLKVERTPVGE